MQTYTHITIAAMIWAIIQQAWLKAQAGWKLFLGMALCGFGAIIPDIPAAIFVFLGKPPELHEKYQEPKWLLVTKAISHSLFIWLITFLLVIYYRTSIAHWQYWLALLIGGTSHCVVDILTHAGKEYAETEPNYFWPSYWPKFGQIFGLWEYRIAPGVLKPKDFEAFIFVTTALISFAIWFVSFS